MSYELTEHARKALSERDILSNGWRRALTEPAVREPDPDDVSVERRYLPIPERDGRVLRVVVNTSVEPVRVVSVFFDRRMRGRT